MNTAHLDLASWREHRAANRLQSFGLLLAMGLLFGLLGWLLWGPLGVLVLIVTVAVGIAFNPATSPVWVMRMYRAHPLDQGSAPGLTYALRLLAERAGLAEVPSLYYVPSSMLNAFAVGSRNRSAIALTDGMLRRLDDREIVGVLAHEISHIANNDLWVMGLADIFSRATSIMSLFGQLLLLLNLPLLLLGMAIIDWWLIALLIAAPHLSALAQLALSRTREYDADLNAAYLTGDPAGLASALLRIERVQGGWLERILLPGRKVPEPSLLRTHPETRDRVARLSRLAGKQRDPRLAFDASSLPGRQLHSVQRSPRWHVSGLWH